MVLERLKINLISWCTRRDYELFGCSFFFKSACFLQRSFLVQHGAVDIITLEGATITCDNTLSPA